ncbi:unnamed protein product [Closterium sp. Naga37s-1]|nr:unnamed protein product [Closterium sp. Naga37s-1]
MVIAGGLEPLLERTAASSAAPANSQTVAEKATTATKPPLPPALKPGTAVSEMPPPLVAAVPVAASSPAQSAPVPAPSAPAAAAIHLASHAVSSATVLDEAGVDPPVPAPAAPVAMPAAVPAGSAPAAALSSQAASATTGGPAPLAPAVTSMAPAGSQVVSSPSRLSTALPAAGALACSPRWSGGLEGSPRAWRWWGVPPACDDGGSTAGSLEGGA